MLNRCCGFKRRVQVTTPGVKTFATDEPDKLSFKLSATDRKTHNQKAGPITNKPIRSGRRKEYMTATKACNGVVRLCFTHWCRLQQSLSGSVFLAAPQKSLTLSRAAFPLCSSLFEEELTADSACVPGAAGKKEKCCSNHKSRKNVFLSSDL